MEKIPSEVREYLCTGDSLARAELLRRHPDLPQTLTDTRTRQAVFGFLSSDEAWADDHFNLALNAIDYLRTTNEAQDARVIRAFLLHPNAPMRLRAYGFLITLYFPDTNREALYVLLQGMLMDRDDLIRAQAPGYIERADAFDEMKNFLLRWRKLAPSQGWKDTDSYELVDRLLEK